MNLQELYSIFLEYPVVCTDSRTIAKDCIFFALKGENFNGNSFAASAITQGASYAVIDEKEFATHDRCILVEDVLQTLQQLANHHRNQFQIPFMSKWIHFMIAIVPAEQVIQAD